MKATNEKWVSATENLMQRRKQSGSLKQATVPSQDYIDYITKCGVGESVLDVGCGSQTLKLCLTEGVKYYGLDAFPIDGIDCFETAIEDFKGRKFDTVCAFAVLDNCRDFDKAIEVMAETAQQNIIILTGIGINPDQYHTFRLEFEDFNRAFEGKGFELTIKENLYHRVWLLNYQKLA